VLIQHRNATPIVDSSAYVAPTAVLVGRVRLGPRSRVMYGAVIDSEAAAVDIGECAIVCEHAVLRATAEGPANLPVILGDHVFVGPHATLLGCTVASFAYIATGATVLHGANVGEGGVIAVGALVHAGTVVPDGYFVPPNAIAIGDPVALYSPSDRAELSEAIKAAGFARRAFGVAVAWEDRRERYRQATEVRSREFGWHADDVLLDD
jgi:carbonic anhydrase/acetyltransferase-like protein (isoleucine patch superfamily)